MAAIRSDLIASICCSALKNRTGDIDEKDNELILKMSDDNFKKSSILASFDETSLDDFRFFFERFSQGLDSLELKKLMSELFPHIASKKNSFVYESLEAVGYRFSAYLDNISWYEFKSLLPEYDVIIDSFPAKNKKFKCSRILISLIQANNFIGFKYLFTKYKLSPSMYIYKTLAKSNNLVFIDYLWMNRSTCFTKSSPTDVKTFFTTLFNHASTNGNMPLLHYLVKNNCIDTTDTKNVTQEPYFTCKEPIADRYGMNVLVHCVDNRFFDSIDPYVPHLLNFRFFNSGASSLLEYIYRNQDKFKTTISFQLLFDQLISKLSSDKSNFQHYHQLLGTFVHRYGCQLNDSHYHHLAQFPDGLTLFGHIPNSIFTSNTCTTIKKNDRARPLKKQKQ
ncbi:hypothetical protein CYY_010273 [Polysphondylium violaceum]|uniref:Uncharacterized protein n=1 Tax=Polysphondylium violaceum TaxID=133409 RepID=A0A8J4V1W9_9MYCE|nr:hypothetical protein CYY_010273 [Polysphondylium violaceum]